MLFNFRDWCLPHFPAKDEDGQLNFETRHDYSSEFLQSSPENRWRKSKLRKSIKKSNNNIRDDQEEDDVEESPELRRTNEKCRGKKTKKKGSDSSVRSENLFISRSKDQRNIFRERDVQSTKSEPHHTSILAESFYSDDSIENDELTYEVDYATSTPLFEALEENDWSSVLFFLRTGKFFSRSHFTRLNMDSPAVQVRTWVHSRDEYGEILWRQLPLHAAICLSAPLRVIHRLVELYPEAIFCRDCYDNLPFDLALKLNKKGSYVLEAVSAEGSCGRPLTSSQSYGRDTVYNNKHNNDLCKHYGKARTRTYSTDEDTYGAENEEGEVLAMVNDDEFELYYY